MESAERDRIAGQFVGQNEWRDRESLRHAGGVYAPQHRGASHAPSVRPRRIGSGTGGVNYSLLISHGDEL
jgi:hypothetical protein